MKAERLYYAALSAALMAKAEPALAQQLAYQLAYLTANPKLQGHSVSTPSHDAATEQQPVNDATQTHQAFASSAQQSPQRWPINPLNHVDWLGGGRLNERWLKQQKFATGKQPHTTTRTIRPPSQGILPATSPAGEERVFNRINDAIMRALVQSDPDAQHKFAVALFACLCHYRWPIPDAERGIYWLIMHSVRCYLYGTRLQWGKAFVDNTEARECRNPMYQIVSECLNHPQPERSQIALKQVMMQLNLLPPILQIQCLDLGIVYRDPHAAATDKCSVLHDVLNLSALNAALGWFWGNDC
ncbi:hypothetical protein [Vibrio gazogenes]|uniref:Uncharacterized protein n=1 Tax=Vibrio gazogenes DSM 21264 = NBRC 103151 TaxID=1123492 RepID=A0A1M5HHJ3_VIBGA|nr:hypothetical protein [Vibrio gazogenes]USP13266.1 hypothetical protein MKS89_12725 [Vibrio gazogenes]SHG15439.1 hypothetical protein SAMN02745781_04100 [Vibrio gazogenes DSM 21264] [Vibrio gazogenes DSM 21264 = NBRC 103151]SJN56718.1 hypothetical protein BQ6471_02175 [Vibrio gazogenes]